MMRLAIRISIPPTVMALLCALVITVVALGQI
jgi:hypothetical protein